MAIALVFWVFLGHFLNLLLFIFVVCGMMHIKESLLIIKKRLARIVLAAGFLSHYLSGPLPYA